MGIIVYQAPDGLVVVGGDNPSVEWRGKVEGTSQYAAAEMALRWYLPATVGNLVLQTPKLELEDDEIWIASATYGLKAPPEVGDSSYQFDTGGGTEHISHSLELIGSYAPPDKTAPDCKGAIGFDGDSVNGVDITVPVYNFSETHYLPASLVTGAYKAILFNLTGTVANASFRGFSKGELLFAGAAGSKRSEDMWEVAFKFAASPNKTNITVGAITVASKEGWHYLDIRYDKAVDEAAPNIIPDPIAVYVHRVYEYGAFSGMAIGN